MKAAPRLATVGKKKKTKKIPTGRCKSAEQFLSSEDCGSLTTRETGARCRLSHRASLLSM